MGDEIGVPYKAHARKYQLGKYQADRQCLQYRSDINYGEPEDLMMQSIPRVPENEQSVQEESRRHAKNVGDYDGCAIWHPAIEDDA